LALQAASEIISPRVFFNMQKGKLSLSANAFYGFQYLKDINSNIETVNTTSAGDATTKTGSSVSQHQQYGSGSLSMIYDIDSTQNVGMEVSFMSWSQRQTDHNTTSLFGGYYGDGMSYNGKTRDLPLYNSWNVSADYQKFLNAKRTRSFTLSYLFSYAPSHSDNDYYYWGQRKTVLWT
jgi:hypothetical protein